MWVSIWGHRYLDDLEAMELAEVTGSADSGERKPESSAAPGREREAGMGSVREKLGDTVCTSLAKHTVSAQ